MSKEATLSNWRHKSIIEKLGQERIDQLLEAHPLDLICLMVAQSENYETYYEKHDSILKAIHTATDLELLKRQYPL